MLFIAISGCTLDDSEDWAVRPNGQYTNERPLATVTKRKGRLQALKTAHCPRGEKDVKLVCPIFPRCF